MGTAVCGFHTFARRYVVVEFRKILSRPVVIHDANVLGQAAMEAGVDSFDRDLSCYLQ